MAKRENRTMSELVRENFRRAQQPQVDIHQLIRQLAPPPPELVAIREDARRQGANKLTMNQINREVRAVRRRLPEGPRPDRNHHAPRLP